MRETQSIQNSLAFFQKWTSQHAPSVVFRPPAKPAAIENFRKKTGLNLPEELNQTLLIADGETRSSAGMIGNWRLMSINEIQAAWGLLGQLVEKGAFSDQIPEKSPYIRQTWWHSSWIPVSTNDTGDCFCIDTDPPDLQRAGQVLLYLHHQPQRALIASSLSAWFDRIARDLADGLYTFDPYEGFNYEGFMKSALEGKHLLDGLEGKLVT